MNTKSAFKAIVVMLAVPYFAAGAMWLLWLLGYNRSTAVWVGLIALMGLDAETVPVRIGPQLAMQLAAGPH